MKQSYIFFLFYFLLSQSIIAQEKSILNNEALGAPITLIEIPAGSTMMGSELPEESPKHLVNIDGFWMSETEITWEQFETFVFRNQEKERFQSTETLKQLGIDGISSATTPYVDMSFGMGKEGFPAINVTRYSAIMFCQWLTAMTGEFYRLPTEAEWEYACRMGGNETRKNMSEPWVLQSAYAQVNSLSADALGLKGMLGNVSEWTIDEYSTTYYQNSPENNPWNKPTTLYSGVTRGGNWKMEEKWGTCSARLPSTPQWKKRDPQLPKSRWWLTNAPFIGFRIVKPSITPSTEEMKKYWLEVMEDYGN